MIQRPIIISLYLALIGFVVLVSRLMFGRIFSSTLEIFLYSVLNSYYCYDYKSSLLEIDTEMSLELFERQWVYFFGFGFPFTVFLYLFKEIGSSLYFLFFPLMIVLSMDEQYTGVVAYKEERTSKFNPPLLSLAYLPNRIVLRWLNSKILGGTDNLVKS
jgi:hypothetical protein